MEIRRNLAYIHRMKPLKGFLTMAAALLFVFSTANADVPAFLILEDGQSINELAARIKKQGATIRHRIPPRVLIVDLADHQKASSLPGVNKSFLSAVPISLLEPIGLTAVAAGLQWNQNLLTMNKNGALGSMGALRQLVADKSISAPQNIKLTPLPGQIICDWEGVPGAVYYQVQISQSINFNGELIQSHVVAPHIVMPSSGEGTFYVRIRGIDPGKEGNEDDLNGRWSDPASTQVSSHLISGGSAPTLTSPANNLKTEGFTVILEWTPPGATRVQVAKDKTFENTLFDEIVSSGEYACPGPVLQSGDRIYWRIQSREGAISDWSDVREIRIGEPQSHTIDSFINPEAPK